MRSIRATKGKATSDKKRERLEQMVAACGFSRASMSAQLPSTRKKAACPLPVPHPPGAGGATDGCGNCRAVGKSYPDGCLWTAGGRRARLRLSRPPQGTCPQTRRTCPQPLDNCWRSCPQFAQPRRDIQEMLKDFLRISRWKIRIDPRSRDTNTPSPPQDRRLKGAAPYANHERLSFTQACRSSSGSVARV